MCFLSLIFLLLANRNSIQEILLTQCVIPSRKKLRSHGWDVLMTPQIVSSLLIESRRTSPPAWPSYLWTVSNHFLFPSVNSYQDRHKIRMTDLAFRHLLRAVLMGISACRLQIPIQATREWLFNSWLTSSSPENGQCTPALFNIVVVLFSPLK